MSSERVTQISDRLNFLSEQSETEERENLVAVTIPARTVRPTESIPSVWQRNWQSDIRDMTILWHGIFQMNMVESVTVRTVKKHFVCG